ncbi:hypothetical protein P7K49_036389 [Saguinus oedipus]|uniref:Uncharacterized protein n=1 Tax=Saguinus oedipus TaxID=9490 RepID=A0ABQ9TK48_SAGOE|nr:hypothetical protein P7K49_036389 [Saguinus oedipus]
MVAGNTGWGRGRAPGVPWGPGSLPVGAVTLPAWRPMATMRGLILWRSFRGRTAGASRLAQRNRPHAPDPPGPNLLRPPAKQYRRLLLRLRRPVRAFCGCAVEPLLGCGCRWLLLR